MKTVRPHALALAAASLFAPALRAEFEPLKDVNPSGTSLERLLGGAGGRAYFIGNDGVNGPELWSTDGTADGTVLTSPVVSDTGSIDPFQAAGAAGDRIFLSISEGFFGKEPWRSDGSAAGTIRIGDIRTGSADSSPHNWLTFGNQVLFTATEPTPTSGEALWASDGTTLVRIGPDEHATFGVPMTLAPILGGQLHYPSYSKLMRTAGVPGDATLVATLPNASQGLVAVNDRLYFAVTDAAGDNELWSSDGTTLGTARLKDLVPGPASGTPQSLTRVDDRLFFTAADQSAGREVWVSDGTDAGTFRVKDIKPGLSSSNPTQLTAFGGKVYFGADDGVNGPELWASDGTEAGTVIVKQFRAGSPGGFDNYTQQRIQALAGRLFLIVRGESAGNDIIQETQTWSSDGTTAGTTPIGTKITETVTRPPYVAAGGSIFIAALRGTGPVLGREPYAINALNEFGPTWCEAPEAVITDNATTVSRITLPAGITIADLDVSLDLFHGRARDLHVSLRHVDTDTTVALLNLSGSFRVCEGKIIDVRLNSSASLSGDTFCSGTNRLAFVRDASYAPSQSLAPFTGQSLGGTWELRIVDNTATNAGTLHAWCLHAVAKQTADPVFTDGFE